MMMKGGTPLLRRLLSKNRDLTSKNGTFKIYRGFMMAKLACFTSLKMIYGYIELCHEV